MKSINELQNNPGKALKNEELLILKGGDDHLGCCGCYVNFNIAGFIAASSVWDCAELCNYIYGYNPPQGIYSNWNCIE